MMNTDIIVLDNLMALNLDVKIWTTHKKLPPADLGGAELPPEELASLGSKKIGDPKELRIFGTLKACAVNLLDRTGVRFLGGWGIPEDKTVYSMLGKSFLSSMITRLLTFSKTGN